MILFCYVADLGGHRWECPNWTCLSWLLVSSYASSRLWCFCLSRETTLLRVWLQFLSLVWQLLRLREESRLHTPGCMVVGDMRIKDFFLPGSGLSWLNSWPHHSFNTQRRFTWKWKLVVRNAPAACCWRQTGTSLVRLSEWHYLIQIRSVFEEQAFAVIKWGRWTYHLLKWMTSDSDLRGAGLKVLPL